MVIFICYYIQEKLKSLKSFFLNILILIQMQLIMGMFMEVFRKTFRKDGTFGFKNLFNTMFWINFYTLFHVKELM